VNREARDGRSDSDEEELHALAHVFVGAAEAIAFRAVGRPGITLGRVADHLMAVLWPVVRELPKRAASGMSGRSGVSSSTVSR
jgi:hypothetical protein